MSTPQVNPFEEIQKALHASRMIPLMLKNPHGPLGLEHLAETVARIPYSPVASKVADAIIERAVPNKPFG